MSYRRHLAAAAMAAVAGALLLASIAIGPGAGGESASAQGTAEDGELSERELERLLRKDFPGRAPYSERELQRLLRQLPGTAELEEEKRPREKANEPRGARQEAAPPGEEEPLGLSRTL